MLGKEKNMYTSVTKKNILTLIIPLILILSVTLTSSKSASAASKEYEVYKEIKPGMTLTETAKLIYGKTYKSHLKKEYGFTIFSKKPLYRDIWEENRNYEFGFYSHDKKSKSSYTYHINLGFFTKPDSKNLYVGWKSYAPKNPSTKKFYKGKKPTYGMTIIQIDKILSGKGLGVFDSVSMEDLRGFGLVDQNNEEITFEKESWIDYNAKSYTGKKSYLMSFKYDYKKQTYIYTKK